ncbi:MAG: hypothetical protein EA401_06915 [Planctomycetota bacterium]|nr:MAG: hypothetical protein EA401_06915 [Planctomycetota bacterium]
MTETTEAPSTLHPCSVALGALKPETGWLGRGDQATLRRSDPSKPGCKPLYVFLAELERLNKKGTLTFLPSTKIDNEIHWHTLLACLCRVSHGDASLGQALADANYHEQRLERLLQADADSLPRELDRAARFLEVKGQNVNTYHIFDLLFKQDKDTVRRQIARTYYAHIHSNKH